MLDDSPFRRVFGLLFAESLVVQLQSFAQARSVCPFIEDDLLWLGVESIGKEGGIRAVEIIDKVDLRIGILLEQVLGVLFAYFARAIIELPSAIPSPEVPRSHVECLLVSPGM